MYQPFSRHWRTPLLGAFLLGGCQSLNHQAPSVEPPAARDRPAVDQDDLFTDLDLEKCVDFAVRHHAGLHAARARWEAATAVVPQVSSLPDPMFSFTWFAEELQTRTGPQERRYGITQAVPWPGKRGLRGDVAQRDADAFAHDVATRRLLVIRDVTIAYHEYAFLGRSLLFQADSLQLLKQLEPIVQGRIRAGGSQADLLGLQVEIGKLDNDLASRRRVRQAMSARLAAAMNLQTTRELPMPELTVPETWQTTAAEVRRRALTTSPTLHALQSRIAARRNQVELAGIARRPDFTFGIDYFETGNALNPSTPGSGDDPVSLRVGLNLPIFGDRYAGIDQQARALLRVATLEHDDFRARLFADIELELFNLQDSTRQMTLYRDNLLPRVREALRITQASYRAGTAVLLSVIDNERTLLAFDTAYWRAVRDHLLSTARLTALIGGKS